MHPVSIIAEIAKAKTAKAKSAIIVENKDNAQLELAVRTALNSQLAFHTKKLTFIEPKIGIFSDAQAAQNTFEDFINMLLRLDAKGSCDGNDQRWLDEVYSSLSVEDRSLCDMVIGRSISCGVGLSKWRLAYGDDFLPDFPCYLSSAFDEDAINQYIFGYGTKQAYSEIKSDGQRMEAIVRLNGDHSVKDISLHSRKGNKYMGLSDLEMEIMLMCSNYEDVLARIKQPKSWDKGFVLDGELVVVDDCGNVESRSTGNGKISKFLSGKGDPVVGSMVTFVVWDIIPIGEFDGVDAPHNQFRDRREVLHNFLYSWNQHNKDNSRIWLQESILVNDLGGAMDHYANAISRGEEGTILKQIDGVWNPCYNKYRPNSQFKFKEEFQNEFKIVGWYKGKDKKKYADAIGGFIIESFCGKVRTNCGGGISDEIRFDKTPDRFVGVIITVSFNGLSEAKGRDTYALTHPRMEEIRSDKTTADSIDKIKADIESSRQLRKLMSKK